MGVAKIVEADAWKSAYAPDQICKLMGEARRLFGLAINATTDQRVAKLTNSKGQ